MNFESDRLPSRNPAEIPPEARAILRQDDDDAVNEFHPLPQGDFSDSARDLLQGTTVQEVAELSPGARKILEEQESRYAQLQTDILSTRHGLESTTLTPEERLELNQKLVRLEQRARQIDSFLQEARKFAGPLQ